MSREKLKLRHLPDALQQTAHLTGGRPSLVPTALIGAVLGGLVAYFALRTLVLASSVIGILSFALALFFGLCTYAISARVLAKSSKQNDPVLARAAKAARKGAMSGEAMAVLEACALHRRRVHSVADDLEPKGAHWSEIASDARNAADRSFVRAMRLCAPFARKRSEPDISEILRESLEGDLDDLVESLVRPRDVVLVDTQRMPEELEPVSRIANELKRLATELEGHASAQARPGATRSETDEILERLRLTREAEQELHRDVNA